MKLIAFIFVITALFQVISNKLEVVIGNEKENILTLGIENPLTALIESTSKKDVVLTTDNGTIEKRRGNEFVAIPLHVGITKINVCKVIKKDTVIIGTKEFRVHQLPDPNARIAGLSGGPIKKNTAIKMGGIIARIECCGFDFPVTITEFTLITIRDSTLVGISKNTGPRYNEKSLALLNQLQPNDHLIVSGLVTLMPQQTRLIHPIEFVIEE